MANVLKKFSLILAGIVAGASLSYLGLKVSASNLLGWLLIFVGLGYFLGGAVYLALAGTPNAVRREAGDRSIWLLAPGFMVVFWGAPLEYLYLPHGLPHTAVFQIAGAVCLAVGLLLRAWVRRALGRMYTGHVQVLTSHRLIQEGPYRLMRHPGYAGFLWMGLGLSLGLSSLVGLAAVPLLLLPGLWYRMGVEERLLVEEFGDTYRQYTRTTHRLFPTLATLLGLFSKGNSSWKN